jgi:hypothetical protein
VIEKTGHGGVTGYQGAVGMGEAGNFDGELREEEVLNALPAAVGPV